MGVMPGLAVIAVLWCGAVILWGKETRCPKCGGAVKFTGHDYGWPDIGDLEYTCVACGHVIPDYRWS